MSGHGYTNEQRWGIIKETTQFSDSLASRTMHDLAMRYETRRDLGLLPPEYAFPVQRVSPHNEALGLLPLERPTMPATPETSSGGIVQEIA